MTHIDNTARVAVEGGRIMTGFLAGLTAEQAAEALAYDGQDIHGYVPVATQLELLPPGFIYLGSPYSLYEHGHDKAAAFASEAAGYLMLRGFSVFAPIPHGHFITSTEALPPDWPFWKRQCEPFIDAASALVVLKLDGWRDSVGLTYEIARFHEAGKPIVYVTMEELANG